MANLHDALGAKTGMVRGPNGSPAHASTLNANLDFFYGTSRETPEDAIASLFRKAYGEDPDTAVCSLLCALDVRGGKGERRIFKTAFRELVRLSPEDAGTVLSLIPELGRWDYIFEAAGTPLEEDAFSMAAEQLALDREAAHPSLLAKWMPSHRTHGRNSPLAARLAAFLGMDERTYRKTLAELRERIRVTERLMSSGRWGEIDYSAVPAKAMAGYAGAFRRRDPDRYGEWERSLSKGEESVNAKGLLCYEVVRRVLRDPGFPGLRWPDSVYSSEPEADARTRAWLSEPSVLDPMWEAQEDFLGEGPDILVVADTSGSMFTRTLVPISASLGLAVYTAERNRGPFRNSFITFSSEPVLQDLGEGGIREKLSRIRTYVENTDIDKVLSLVLETAKEAGIGPEGMPSKVLVLSDMAFDEGADSRGGTNLDTWRRTYEEAGYPLPQVVFWNLAERTFGAPATAEDGGVALLSGFSPALLRDVLRMEEISPVPVLLRILEPYRAMLEKERNVEVQ